MSDTVEGLFAKRARSEQLLREIQAIDAQLGERHRIGVDGRRMDDRSYWAWRTAAIQARRCKLDERRLIRESLRGTQPMVLAGDGGIVPANRLTEDHGMGTRVAARLQEALEAMFPQADAEIVICADGTCKVRLWSGDRSVTIYGAGVDADPGA